MKILVSGGHLTPALAFIDYVQKEKKSHELLFVGREFTREADQQPSREREEVESRNISFIALQAPKLNSKNPFIVLKQTVRLLTSVSQMVSLIIQQKPDVFVSFGSYLAVPISLACWLQQVPIVTHEQTRSVGLSNKFIGRFAKTIALSYPESAQFFPAHKTKVTGNLLRKQLLKKATQKPQWFSESSQYPLLYVTGGSQGSEVVNSTVAQALPQLLRNWQIIHQCGAASKNRSYLEELEKRSMQLSKTHQKRYFVREWVSEDELSWIYKHATAAISRAGANTTQELAYYRLPAVLIPLPFSNYQEQQKNAEALAATGGAVMISQRQFTPENLINALDTIRSKYKACKRKLATIDVNLDADKKLFNLVAQVASAAHEKTPKKTKQKKSTN